MTLKERLAAKYANSKDLKMDTQLYKASNGITPEQKEALMTKAGQKLPPSIFAELNRQANLDDDDEEPFGKYKPTNLSKRRMYPLKEASPNGAKNGGGAKRARKRIVDSDDYSSSSGWSGD